MTTVVPATAFPAAPFGVAQHQGTRTVQCDAYAIAGDGSRWAAVVVDGIGDENDIARLMRFIADHIATRILEESPAAAIRATRIACDAELNREDGVVVAFLATGDTLSTAWAGDSALYWLDEHGTLETATREHTVAQQARDRGRVPGPGDEHVVLRTVGWGDIEETELPIDRVHRVLLCSDGVHKVLDEGDIAWILRQGDPATAAAALVSAAVSCAAENGRPADNATAIVWDPVRSGE
ncbi:PP2C family protein-serine/threonine phosphatase [Embleya sp. NPDC059237]|uniref:PP2C family protein-serine/threonine phosphatase n=1 Tax=Embleya sp. NPDC059237 TaxID=3346784 RepID=UPI00369C9116